MLRGLYAQQMSLDTVGHNISNASTEGYSRQRVNLSTTMPQDIYGTVGHLQIGSGVNVETITRLRDSFMDQQMWKESCSLSYGNIAENMYTKIEDVFHDDPGVTGIQSALNNFWNSWQTLTANGAAANDSPRLAVRERGNEMVQAIQRANEQLRNMITDVNSSLEINAQKVNQITSEISELNRQISQIEIGGRSNANDLRDKRDLLVDNLSKLIDVRVSEDKDHNYIINARDVTLVDNIGYTKLALNKPKSAIDPDYGYEYRYLVVADGSETPVTIDNGEIGALQHTNTKLVKGYLDDLSTMSQYLLQDFNDVHRAGFGSDNSTGYNFFGDQGVNYSTTPLTKKGAWIDKLLVNQSLYNADGLSKIAAKTAEAKTVTQSNAAAGKATVGIGPLPGGYQPPSKNYQSYQISVNTVGAGGHVTAIDFRTQDGSGAWSAPVTIAIDPDGTFHLPHNVKFSIADDTDTAIGNTYSFSLPQGNASGDNAGKLSDALKMPSKTTSVLKGAGLDDYYESVVADLGIRAQGVKSAVKNQDVIVNQIQTWRESVSGVNMDEEMSNMIRFQKGYNAAARVVTTMDEMLDKLINGMGVVGR